MDNPNIKIRYMVGDMFRNDGVLVNPVNTIGVMGKGLALEFKNRYGNMYNDDYIYLCKTGGLDIGKCSYYQLLQSNNVINFPTKKHYKDPSKLEYIKKGMDSLISLIKEYNISKLSIPALGCGLGNLDYKDVKKIITESLLKSDIDFPVLIDLFLPDIDVRDISIILSIDPSLTNLGWAVSFIKKDKFYVLDSGTLNPKKLASKRKQEFNTFGPSVITTLEVEGFIEGLLYRYQPNHIASEDAFYCSRMPKAFASLVLCINTIKRAVYNFNKHDLSSNVAKTIETYAPRLVKKVASTYGGSSDKKDMSESLKNNKNIIFLDERHKEFVLGREHEVDAVCIGFTYFKEHIEEKK